MPSGFFELAVIILLASVLGFVARALKQPTLLAYLATGAILGIFETFQLAGFETFHVFSDLGIMFLLFLVGLEVNYTSLRLVGKPAALIGLGQIILTFVLGLLLAATLGFPALSAAYISIALTFSSTIIVIKLLTDKRDLGSLYGKMSVGVLLVQDLAAILILVMLAGLAGNGDWTIAAMTAALVKALILFGAMFWLGRKVLPVLFGQFARSQELLFVTSLAWVFLLAVIVNRMGFSVEIAGFLAGVALANSSEHFQIAAKIRPLRDFFLVIFFALLGSTLVLSNFTQVLGAVIVFLIFVLVVKPLVVLVLMGLLGYRKRTSFLTGVALAQISEFSLVLVALGLKLGHINESEVALITSVGVISMTVSSYLMVHGDYLYKRLSRFLSVFERRFPQESRLPAEQFTKPIVVVGYHRTGQSIVKALPKKDVLVIDFDPEIISLLRDHGYDHLFGDMMDAEIFETANLASARLIISTSPDLEDNLTLLSFFRHLRRRPKVIVRAESERDAEILYEHGASYVLVPHISSGHYLGRIIAQDPELRTLQKLRYNAGG